MLDELSKSYQSLVLPLLSHSFLCLLPSLLCLEKKGRWSGELPPLSGYYEKGVANPWLLCWLNCACY